jgi:SAM-dependent methyltransferase
MSARANPIYDEIGRTYRATRGTDPRLVAAIWRALGDARRVLNVGAGTGAYEPADRAVVALEPSGVMIAQRPPTAAPALQGSAEALPFDAESLDAGMAVLSDHHWQDRASALSELRRVARHRVVLFNADPAQAERFLITSEYLPGFLDLIPAGYREPGTWISDTEEALGARIRSEAVPIPHDCQDGFYGAFWRPPHAYLEERVREGSSVFARLERHEVRRAVRRLRDDLASGRWQTRHATLAVLDALDLGYTLLIARVD